MVIGRRLVSLLCHWLELCCSLVLPFVRVVLFSSSAIFGSWVREHVRRGRHVECFKSRFLCYTSPTLFDFFFFGLPFSLSYGFYLEWLLSDVIF